MSILVACSSCKSTFRVSDKFAGKEGPCPKCKAKIKVPEVEDVKIHVPEEAAAPAAKGASPGSTKPIRRQETKLTATAWVAIGGGTLAVLLVAIVAGQMEAASPVVAGIGLVALSPPLVFLCYSILRDEELEPYRGVQLWIRVAICAAVYAAGWAAFAFFIPEGFPDEIWGWLYIAPPFFIIGGLAALACFDFEFTTGAVHYGIYVLVTLVLGYLAGLSPLSVAT